MIVVNTIIICFLVFPLFKQCEANNKVSNITTDVKNKRLYKKAAFLMGTIMTISVYGNDDERINHAVQLAFDEAKRLETLMSNYSNDSELSRINRLAINKPIKCDSELLHIIEDSIHYYNITNGAFDITISPLINLWGLFANNNGDIVGNIPNEKELDNIMPAISCKNIVISEANITSGSGRTIFFKNPLTQIDLGAIGKGYAVDKVVKILQKEGLDSALVNFAGNIFAYGSPDKRHKWTIGLRDPKDTSNILGAFKIKDRAVSTSGNYERFFVKDGKQYTHIIDPRTGKPVSEILSVTILAETATKADALSTGIFVLGSKKGFELIEQLENVEGVIMSEDNDYQVSIEASKGFEEILDLNQN